MAVTAMAAIDSALWRNIRDYLRQKHPAVCRQWFDELQPVELNHGTLVVNTATAVQQAYLHRKCRDHFTEAAQMVTGALVAVQFVTGETASDSAELLTIEEEEERRTREGEPVTVAAAPRPPAAPVYLDDATDDDLFADEMVISPDYSFDNFVTGPGNDLAYAASVAVANQPGTAYNPLFIHGGVGLGKTHLLQAICQIVLQRTPPARICYLSCETFVNQFLDCVQRGEMTQFRHRYRHVDLLVIDDIHFLADRDRSQEEFFHTFNALYQANKQIVLSSDRPPAEIPKLEERLVSRFGWGLVATVSKPDFETRMAIVRAKSKIRGIVLPDDVVSYVASKIDTNARELEGAITTIQGHAALKNLPITLPLAQQALGDPAAAAARAQITFQQIVDVVTRYYSVRLADLQSKKRHKSITEPRQICMWLARKLTRFSLEEIGGHFGGRDHTTVMHSIRTVEERRESDAAFNGQMDHLEEEIGRGKS
jgi:chromosomal replication initiator protein